MQKQIQKYIVGANALLVISILVGGLSISNLLVFISIALPLFALGGAIGVGRGRSDWRKVAIMTALVVIVISGSFTLALLADAWVWAELLSFIWAILGFVGLLAYTMFVGREKQVFIFLLLLGLFGAIYIATFVANPKYSQALSHASCLTYVCSLTSCVAGLCGGYGWRIKERAEAMVSQGS